MHSLGRYRFLSAMEVVALAGLAYLLLATVARGESPAKIELVPQILHSNEVRSVAFSPDGSRVLSGSDDNTLKLCDTATGALIRTFAGHAGSVYSVAFSPDGAHVLSGSDDKTLKLWDAATGALIRTFEGHSFGVRSVAFSPDGKRVLSGSEDDTAKLWDAATGALIRTFNKPVWNDLLESVAFSPDGKSVLAGSYVGALKLWDATTGLLIRTLKGHSNEVTAVAFSPDGTRLLSGSADHTLKVWDASTGTLMRTIRGHSRGVTSVAFSPHGTRVLSGSHDKTLKLWDAATGALIRTFAGHSDYVYSVAFSPDGAHVLSGSDDTTVKLWDVAKGTLLRIFAGQSEPVKSVAFSPDRRRVLSGSRDKTLKLWDSATGALVRTFAGHSGQVNSVAFSPDGTRVLSGSADQTMKLWDAATGALIRTFVGNSDVVTSVAFSPDGSCVLSGYWNSTVKMWDAATGLLLRTFSLPGLDASVTFSPDGKSVLAGSAGSIRLWDATTGTLLRTFAEHTAVFTVAFSPDGTRFLSGGLSGTVELWDAATGALVRTFAGHSGQVNSVAFSPDGAHVLSGSDDTTVKLWDLQTGELLASMLGEPDGEWVTITPKGFFVTSPKGPKALTVVREFEVYSIDQFFRDLYSTELVEEALKGDPEGKYKDAAYKLDLEKVLDSGPAPQLELLEKKTEQAGGTVRLAVRITDTGGGIGNRLEWRVKSQSNPQGQIQGRVQPDELKGRAEPSSHAVTVTETLTVDPSQPNTVEVTAYNGKKLIATLPLRITLDAFGATTEDRPRMYVLAIGVNKYKMKDYELRYAAEDAESVAKALEAVGGELFAKVFPIVLKDKEVTAAAIGMAFEEIGATAKPNDVFVLFLSGHGKSVEGRYYFYPQSLDFAAGETYYNGIGQDLWQEWLAKVHANKTLLILDTCESGSAGGLIRGASSGRQTAMDQLQHATGQNLIAAAGSSQAAIEGFKGHGVLTYAVLNALNKKEGEAVEEKVKVSMLANYVDEHVPEITQKVWGVYQKPVLKMSGNDFPIGIRAALLTETKPEQNFVGKGFILLRDERVREQPMDGAAGERMLDAATIVDVVKYEGNWALIAIAGQKIGYVPADTVKRPH